METSAAASAVAFSADIFAVLILFLVLRGLLCRNGKVSEVNPGNRNMSSKKLSTKLSLKILGTNIIHSSLYKKLIVGIGLQIIFYLFYM